MATYPGTATGKSATGYVVTADYGGELSKTTCDTVVYTAVFSGTKTQDITDTVQTASFDLIWLVIPTVVPLLAGGGYLGYLGVKRYQNKKRGYE